MNKQEQIGLKIKLARQEANMTQEELGAKTGYSAMGISYMEKGSRDIKIRALEVFAKELKKDINFFLEPLVEHFKSENPTNASFRRGSEDLSLEESAEEKRKIKEFEKKVRSLYGQK